MSDRMLRVNSILREVLAEEIERLSDERLEFVTVTGVDTARNLRNATVSVSVFGHENERGRILRALADKHAELQALINRDCHLKYTPRLRFVLDTSIEKGDHVLALINGMESAGEIPVISDQ